MCVFGFGLLDQLFVFHFQLYTLNALVSPSRHRYAPVSLSVWGEVGARGDRHARRLRITPCRTHPAPVMRSTRPAFASALWRMRINLFHVSHFKILPSLFVLRFTLSTLHSSNAAVWLAALPPGMVEHTNQPGTLASDRGCHFRHLVGTHREPKEKIIISRSSSLALRWEHTSRPNDAVSSRLTSSQGVMPRKFAAAITVCRGSVIVLTCRLPSP